jgi:hypothetical protein
MFGGSRYKNHQQKRIYIVAVEKNRCRKWKKGLFFLAVSL